jgi:hypothetical protein
MEMFLIHVSPTGGLARKINHSRLASTKQTSSLLPGLLLSAPHTIVEARTHLWLSWHKESQKAEPSLKMRGVVATQMDSEPTNWGFGEVS